MESGRFLHIIYNMTKLVHTSCWGRRPRKIKCHNLNQQVKVKMAVIIILRRDTELGCRWSQQHYMCCPSLRHAASHGGSHSSLPLTDSFYRKTSHTEYLSVYAVRERIGRQCICIGGAKEGESTNRSKWFNSFPFYIWTLRCAHSSRMTEQLKCALYCTASRSACGRRLLSVCSTVFQSVTHAINSLK